MTDEPNALADEVYDEIAQRWAEWSAENHAPVPYPPRPQGRTAHLIRLAMEVTSQAMTDGAEVERLRSASAEPEPRPDEQFYGREYLIYEQGHDDGHRCEGSCGEARDVIRAARVSGAAPPVGTALDREALIEVFGTHDLRGPTT